MAEKKILNTITNAIKTASDALNSVKSSGSTSGTNKESSGSTINGTRVYGEGNNMTIIPKSSGGSGSSGSSNRISGFTHQGVGTSTDYGSYKSDLDRLTKAQRQAQVDQLKAARTKALANLDTQEQTIKPYYENARNLASASSQQGARNFAEYLANRGLTNSGAAAQGEVNRLSALNNNLGNLNTAEANAYRDIANQRTQVENDYAAGLANANNSITNDYYNKLLNYNEQQRQYIQGLQNQALGQYANDYQAYKNQLLAQGYDPNSLEVLLVDAARGNKVNSLYNNGLNNALSNVQNGYINYNNAAALGLTTPQAYDYSNNYQAAQQAAREAEAEALAYNRQQDAIKNELNWNNYLLNQQKVDNDTRQTDATIKNINSQIAKRNTPSTPKTPTTKIDTSGMKAYLNSLKGDKEAQREYLDGLYALNNNRIIDDDTYERLYADYNLYQK